MRRQHWLTGALVAGAGLALACSHPEGEEEVVTDVAVHTAVITHTAVRRYVTAYGYVEPAPAGGGTRAGGAVLSPLSSGVLAEIRAVEGQRVAAGDVLFRLDTRLAEVAVQKGVQDVDFAEKAFARQQQLLRSDGTSQRLVQEAAQGLAEARSALAAARTALAYLEVTAPLAGTVVDLDARVGQAVDATTVLGKIVDLLRLVVTARVPVGDASGMAAGQRVLLGDDSAAARGAVTFVGREVDPRTGTCRVQATIPTGTGLRPGQFIEMHILVEERRGVLAVPEEAVVTRAGQGSWISVVEGDQAVRRAVSIGLRDGPLVEISGDSVAAGMRLVTIEAYGLPERTRIHVVDR